MDQKQTKLEQKKLTWAPGRCACRCRTSATCQRKNNPRSRMVICNPLFQTDVPSPQRSDSQQHSGEGKEWEVASESCNTAEKERTE